MPIEKISLTDAQESKANWAKIRSINETIDSKVLAIKKRTADLMGEVLLCGKLLIRQKEIAGHGNWEKSLALHGGGMSQRHAWSFMEAARRIEALEESSNQNSISDLSNLQGVTDVFIALEVIPDPKLKRKALKELCNATQAPEANKATKSNDSRQPSDASTDQPAPIADANSGRTEPALSSPTCSGKEKSSPSTEAPDTGSPLQSEVQQPTPLNEPDEDTPFDAPGDPLTGVRTSVCMIMKEIERLGDGMNGGIALELGPLIAWAQCRGFC